MPSTILYREFITSCNSSSKTRRASSVIRLLLLTTNYCAYTSSYVISFHSNMARMVTIGSCEPSRCSAYSEDLRWRIVYQCLGLDLSCRKVASNLGVDPSTVSRVVKRFQRTGSVAKEKYNSSTLPRKLTDSVPLVESTHQGSTDTYSCVITWLRPLLRHGNTCCVTLQCT